MFVINVGDTMKKSILLIVITLSSMLLISCEKETDSLLKDMEQQQALAITNVDALRSMKSRPHSYNGEKGRDHRDILGNDNMGIRYSTMSEIQKGDIIVSSYDEKTELFTAEIYWGDEISEEEKMMFYDANVSLIFKREGYGVLLYNNGCYYDYYHSYYKPGDKFTFTKYVWWVCTDVEVRMHYRNPDHPNSYYYKSWTLPFESLKYIKSDKIE